MPIDSPATSKLILALSFAAFVGAGSPHALAQDCPCTTPPVSQAISSASAIFVGKVMALTSDPASSGMILQNGQWRSAPADVSIVSATIQVETLFKGGSIDKTAVVSTPSVCGYPFQVGSTVLVFAARNPSGLWTDACKGNAAGQAVAAKTVELRRALGLDR